MKISANTILSSGLVIFLVISLLVIIVSIKRSEKVQDTSVAIANTEHILSSVQQTLQYVLDNETGARGYLITGDEKFLEPLSASEIKLDSTLHDLKENLKSDPVLSGLADSLGIYISKRIEFSQQLVSVARNGDLPSARSMVLAGTGKLYTDRIRELGKRVEEEEHQQLEIRKRNNEKNISRLNYILYGVLGISFISCVMGVQRIRRDIKQHKQSEEQFRSLLDAAPDATVIVNRDGIIQMVNLQTEKLFGYSRSEMLGQPVEILIPAALRSRHRQHREGFVQTARTRSMGEGIELHAVKKNGTRFPVEISLSPLTTEDGILVSAAVRDISIRKELENELKKSNEEMEAFTYSVSHDLRAPLRGIIGFTTILEEDYAAHLDEEARRLTSVIKQNTLRMGNLIDDLLAFSRTGKKEITKTDVDTNEMVEDLIKEYAAQTRIYWKTGLLLPVRADRNTIRQVWVNLIGNAVKYSAKNEKPVIETGSYLENGTKVFFVKDNGVGFDPRYSHKLFRVFQRLHNADEFEGTGVGLALVEKIIQKHDGRIWAESEPGKGACFYFSLPV